MNIEYGPISSVLTVRDHLSAKIADGDCVLKRLHPSGRVRIEHADPRLTIGAQVLDSIRRNPGPGVSLNDDILRIEGVNRTVVYRIGAKVPDQRAYYAEWPDC